MKSLLRQPAFWLAVLVVFSFANSHAAHRFQLVIEPDSKDYRDFDWSSLTDVLSNKRTPGYPLFLAIVSAVSDHPSAVPIAHWLMLIAASLVFYRGLTQAGYPQSSAVFAAGAIMLSRGMLKFGQVLTADSLAISLSIASAGCFFATLSPRARIGSWIGLALATFLTYQTRPAYLFLIPLWPLLGFAVDRLIVHRETHLAVHVRTCLKYCAATLVPCVAYCTLRLCIVGHFGIVSFGGYNFIGVVGQFLVEATVDRLSPQSQALGREMLELRAELAGWEPPRDFLTMEQMYNPTVWDLAVPAAENVHGDAPVAVNAALSRLGNELFWLHRGQYTRWLLWNGWHGVVQIVQLTALDRGTVVLMLLLLAAHATALWRGPSVPRENHAGETAQANEVSRFLELHLLCWTAFAFAAAKATLVVLVEPANDRYMTGAMTLLPAALAIFGVCHIRRVFPSIGLLDRKET